MRRQVVINVLTKPADVLHANGILALFLFGSHVRDEAKPESDMDLFFDRDQADGLSLIKLTQLQFQLEEIRGVKVDLRTRTGLHPALRPEIERTAVKMF